MATPEFKPLPPQEAIAYLKAKGFSLPETFDWRDMWQEAHATAFTVAKSAGFDVNKDIFAAVLKAKEQGTPFEQFRKELTPILQAKGWWGRKDVFDDLKGETVSAQLGSPRRLRIIYDTNMRTAHAAGRWSQIQQVKTHRPFLRYVAVMDGRTRPEHAAWNGTVLPVDHPWWSTHFPPNGWHCRCTVEQLSQANMDEFGYKVSPDPKEDLVSWINGRTGEEIWTPRGIDPGFAYNAGQVALEENAARALMGKMTDATPDMAAAQAASARFVVPALKRELGSWISDVATAAEGGAPITTGDRRVVGALSEPVLDFLRGKDIEPASGAISLDDKGVTHMYREAKRARGDALSIEELAALPDVFAQPKAVLWDKQNPALIYIVDHPTGVGKVVVQLDYATKVMGPDGREVIRTNNIRSAKIVTEPSVFKAPALYEVIEGSL